MYYLKYICIAHGRASRPIVLIMEDMGDCFLTALVSCHLSDQVV